MADSRAEITKRSHQKKISGGYKLKRVWVAEEALPDLPKVIEKLNKRYGK